MRLLAVRVDVPKDRTGGQVPAYSTEQREGRFERPDGLGEPTARPSPEANGEHRDVARPSLAGGLPHHESVGRTSE